MIEKKSKINYNYSTIKLTKSRIEKGLIAIPRSLADWFPDHNTTIQVYLDGSKVSETKKYSSFSSSTNESRIGGMRRWIEKNGIRNDDEVVIQIIDKEKRVYKLISENRFIKKTQELQNDFDKSETEKQAIEKIIELSEWIELNESKVALYEYQRLTAKTPFKKRHYVDKQLKRAREGVRHSFRVLLGKVYHGHCQICDFTFLKKDDSPYFEIHHVNPLQGNHPKNLIVVCANCHRQFEYARVKKKFTQDGWLTKVFFNKLPYPVNQIILKTPLEDFKKQLHV